MKFIYEYRTSDNVPHRGTIAASTKEAAYDALKTQGIKPSKVWEAPGLLNKVFGKGKRWIAITVLLAALLGTGTILCFALKDIKLVNQELEDITLYEERGQIYGPLAVIMEIEADDYASVFEGDLERYLAPYAIPAKKIGSRRVVFPKDVTCDALRKPVLIADTELDEVKKLKRMVNGLKREFYEYLTDGGNVAGYLQRLDIRQKAEAGVYERMKASMLRERDMSVWRDKNAQLRAKGLPMVDPPEE